jgi:hypothetical protein
MFLQKQFFIRHHWKFSKKKTRSFFFMSRRYPWYRACNAVAFLIAVALIISGTILLQNTTVVCPSFEMPHSRNLPANPTEARFLWCTEDSAVQGRNISDWCTVLGCPNTNATASCLLTLFGAVNSSCPPDGCAFACFPAVSSTYQMGLTWVVCGSLLLLFLIAVWAACWINFRRYC